MSTMSTRKSTFTVLLIYVASLLLVAVPAQAQAPVAAVSITCQPAEIKVDVKPGSTLVGFTTCTATNPSSYLEKISISVSSDGLAELLLVTSMSDQVAKKTSKLLSALNRS